MVEQKKIKISQKCVLEIAAKTEVSTKVTYVTILENIRINKNFKEYTIIIYK